MKVAALHHISLACRDIDRSRTFYRDVFGLIELKRPPFRRSGAWLGTGTLEVHLTEYPDGSLRGNKGIDRDDTHFAIRVADFEAAMTRLQANGFREDAPAQDPLRVLVDRKSLAGYPQAYLVDPDGYGIEINAAGRSM